MFAKQAGAVRIAASGSLLPASIGAPSVRRPCSTFHVANAWQTSDTSHDKHSIKSPDTQFFNDKFVRKMQSHGTQQLENRMNDKLSVLLERIQQLEAGITG